MTRKDYELIAQAFAKVASKGNGLHTIAEVVEELTYQLAQDNPRFDTPKFIKAVFGETPEHRLPAGVK